MGASDGPRPAPVIAVVGPTATGKSELALDLAGSLGGEVVNADAMQLYLGMDIGTAKLLPAERRGIEHHLLDVLDVRQEASVAAYQRQARAVIDRLSRAGRVAVLVGGSGLYVRAALDRLTLPPTDPAVRAELEGELARIGSPALHARLAESDPDAAAAILPTNGRRVVRALEVIRLTGGPFRATLPEPAYAVPAVQIGLRVPRPALDARIAQRVEEMIDAGLLAETVALVERGLREGRTARRALGYAQMLEHLDGTLTLAQARDRIITATRRFARRQESWFNRDPRVVWLDADPSAGFTPATLADRATRAVTACNDGSGA